MSATTSARSAPTGASEAWLAIWGMYCPDCQARVEDALRRLPGVLEVEVDWRFMGGRVVHSRAAPGPEEMVKCIDGVDSGAGYRFWAAAGPEVTQALRLSWQLRRPDRQAGLSISTLGSGPTPRGRDQIDKEA